MHPLLECVPNFSEGRDPDFLRDLVEVVAAAGPEVLDASADADHHRSVLTFMGDPESVAAGALAAARLALERIDLGDHEGVHPRIGALDVLPIVPLLETPRSVAREVAGRVAEGIEALGIPVHLYGELSEPPGRSLAELRRGGVEAYAGEWPEGREPAHTAGRSAAHPTAGVTCVGVRPLMLAWNVVVDGVPVAVAREIASEIRETGGGFTGLRALGLELQTRGAVQISMNLEEVESNDPGPVFDEIESRVRRAGGRIVETEVIGMIPDPLVLAAGARRLRVYGMESSRLLSRRIARHRLGRPDPDGLAVAGWIDSLDSVPQPIREAAARLRGPNDPPLVPGESE